MRTLKDDAQQLIDEVAEGGAPYIVCASISHGTGDELKEAVDILGKAGEAAKKQDSHCAITIMSLNLKKWMAKFLTMYFFPN